MARRKSTKKERVGWFIYSSHHSSSSDGGGGGGSGNGGALSLLSLLLPQKKTTALLAIVCGIICVFLLWSNYYVLLFVHDDNHHHQQELLSVQQQQQQQQERHHFRNRNSNHRTITRQRQRPRCSINFFGLPRSFQELVLPSVVQNVIKPNLQYDCDYYIHSYIQEREEMGRGGVGGTIDSNAILLLEKAILDEIKNTYDDDDENNKQNKNQNLLIRTNPIIKFVNDTEEEFLVKRGNQLTKYRNEKSPIDNKYLYYPWRARTYDYPKTLDNIVKQWHSIQSVFELMEETAMSLMHGSSSTEMQPQHNLTVSAAADPFQRPASFSGQQSYYERVAMLRSDVFYAVPIDIFTLDNLSQRKDENNEHAIVPDFAKYPVNDRMIYGRYDAVKIWATERFQRIDEHVNNFPERGWGMHSERFINYTIFSSIEAQLRNNNKKKQLLASSSSSASARRKTTPLHSVLQANPDICFFRVRADTSVWISDCECQGAAGSSRGIESIDKQKMIETMLNHAHQKVIKCERSPYKKRAIQLHCNV